MTQARITNQSNMWSRKIEDPEFEEALGTIKDSREDFEFASQRRALAKAKKIAKAKMAEHGVVEGEWVQVGNLGLYAKELAGGGFEVEPWRSMSPVAIVEAQ
mgnify:FL=1